MYFKSFLLSCNQYVINVLSCVSYESISNDTRSMMKVEHYLNLNGKLPEFTSGCIGSRIERVLVLSYCFIFVLSTHCLYLPLCIYCIFFFFFFFFFFFSWFVYYIVSGSSNILYLICLLYCIWFVQYIISGSSNILYLDRPIYCIWFVQYIVFGSSNILYLVSPVYCIWFVHYIVIGSDLPFSNFWETDK
jgi:hypothetical protein